jgi:hypothetical protein
MATQSDIPEIIFAKIYAKLQEFSVTRTNAPKAFSQKRQALDASPRSDEEKQQELERFLEHAHREQRKVRARILRYLAQLNLSTLNGQLVRNIDIVIDAFNQTLKSIPANDIALAIVDPLDTLPGLAKKIALLGIKQKESSLSDYIYWVTYNINKEWAASPELISLEDYLTRIAYLLEHAECTPIKGTQLLLFYQNYLEIFDKLLEICTYATNSSRPICDEYSEISPRLQAYDRKWEEIERVRNNHSFWFNLPALHPLLQSLESTSSNSVIAWTQSPQIAAARLYTLILKFKETRTECIAQYKGNMRSYRLEVKKQPESQRSGLVDSYQKTLIAQSQKKLESSYRIVQNALRTLIEIMHSTLGTKQNKSSVRVKSERIITDFNQALRQKGKSDDINSRVTGRLPHFPSLSELHQLLNEDPQFFSGQLGASVMISPKGSDADILMRGYISFSDSEEGGNTVGYYSPPSPSSRW